MNSTQKESIRQKFEYELIGERDNYDLTWGRTREYKIKFGNGDIDYAYYGKKTKKYFYFAPPLGGINYCENLEDAIYKVFLYRHI
jgi:hypothetical protein